MPTTKTEKHSGNFARMFNEPVFGLSISQYEFAGFRVSAKRRTEADNNRKVANDRPNLHLEMCKIINKIYRWASHIYNVADMGVCNSGIIWPIGLLVSLFILHYLQEIVRLRCRYD